VCCKQCFWSSGGRWPWEHHPAAGVQFQSIIFCPGSLKPANLWMSTHQTDWWIVPFLFLVETAPVSTCVNLYDPPLVPLKKNPDLLRTWVFCLGLCLPSTIVLLVAYGFQIVEETMWHLNSKLCAVPKLLVTQSDLECTVWSHPNTNVL
jgi:hypothetical protein